MDPRAGKEKLRTIAPRRITARSAQADLYVPDAPTVTRLACFFTKPMCQRVPEKTMPDTSLSLYATARWLPTYIILDPVRSTCKPFITPFSQSARGIHIVRFARRRDGTDWVTAVMVVIMLVIGAAVIPFAYSLANSTASADEQAEMGAGYIIYKDGNSTLAKNGLSSIIEFNSTNDSVVFQAVVDKLAYVGGKIFISPGEFNITTSIIIKYVAEYRYNNQGLSFVGSGYVSTKLIQASDEPVISATGWGVELRFSNLTFLTLNQSIEQPAFYAKYRNMVYLDNVKFDNCPGGAIESDTVVGLSVTNSIIWNCGSIEKKIPAVHVWSNEDAGLRMTWAYFNRVAFEGNPYVSLYIEPSQFSLTVENSWFETRVLDDGTTVPVLAHVRINDTRGGIAMVDLTIQNNLFYDQAGSTAYSILSENYLCKTYITGNVFRGTSDKDVIRLGWCQNVWVQNNYIERGGGNLWAIYAGSGANYGLNISGNQIYMDNLNNTTSGAMWVSGHFPLIHGNSISSRGSSYGGWLYYGIYARTAASPIITGNVISHVEVGVDVGMNSSGIVKDNVFYDVTTPFRGEQECAFEARQVVFIDIQASNATAIKGAVAGNGAGFWLNGTNPRPDYPRVLTATTTNYANPSGIVKLVGVDALGNLVTDEITIVAGGTARSHYAFAEVWSIWYPAGLSDSDTVSIGTTDLLGIPSHIYVTPSIGDSIYKIVVNGIDSSQPNVIILSSSKGVVVVDASTISNGDDIIIYYKAPRNVVIQLG